jgi:hypothetical protein
MTEQTRTEPLDLDRLRVPEWVQPMSNSVASCPWCEGYQPDHGPGCGRQAVVVAVAQAREAARLRSAAEDVSRKARPYTKPGNTAPHWVLDDTTFSRLRAALTGSRP